MDYLFLCDLWAPVTYTPSAILKYYNSEIWVKETELGEKLWLKGALVGEVKWRDGKERDEYTLYWRGSSDELYWRFCLAWMVPQRATSNQSPRSHSLTLLFFLCSFLLTLLICLPHSFSLPPLSFLAPFVSIVHLRGDQCPVSQSN